MNYVKIDSSSSSSLNFRSSDGRKFAIPLRLREIAGIALTANFVSHWLWNDRGPLAAAKFAVRLDLELLSLAPACPGATCAAIARRPDAESHKPCNRDVCSIISRRNTKGVWARSKIRIASSTHTLNNIRAHFRGRRIRSINTLHFALQSA